jgi:hypothetical protein
VDKLKELHKALDKGIVPKTRYGHFTVLRSLMYRSSRMERLRRPTRLCAQGAITVFVGERYRLERAHLALARQAKQPTERRSR